ncbi:hypothetical protein O6H91_06G021800 [Diphasiastrum complanatum]|uniref:Uncharacterized protein n=1 Tax=Diphasiastrum complanatum TaxID=34168 RepID=A0ACC2DBP7_DIPCM|nr:hypothetical protein O6H91_06G021800 [Diphasiastrum complanatum]
MSCLAIALQPVNGPDVLLQTREWFPPARAAYASLSFRATRAAYAAGNHDTSDGSGLGDDALSTASGQVVVGKENRYQVVYRLVNTIYVLGITSTDQDDTVNNIFECAGIVNQAVSVLVAACKGVDVTADKLHRKYTEIYMALDVVLHGISAARLAIILATVHGENLAHIVLSAADAENRARGADSWNQVKSHSLERLSNIEVLSKSTFELPEETIAAGDEVSATLVPLSQPVVTQVVQQPAEQSPTSEDPFAASDALNKPEALVGGFKKNKDSPADVTAALADLAVPVVASKSAESTIVGVEGFEGDYGGLDFGIEEGASGSFGDAFEGLDDAFGGGLDVSEFAATKPEAAVRGLGGLEELEGGGGIKLASSKPQPLTKTDKSVADEILGGIAKGEEKALESKGPVLWLTEEIYAEFKGLALARTGLQGSLQLKTGDPSIVGQSETEFSFVLEGAAGIKRGVLQNSVASSLGQGFFHVRTSPSESPLTVLKYRLQPRFTPIPLRIRLVTKQVGFLLSLMVQYVANPFLPGILKDVTFCVSLPCSPASLKMSPRGLLNRSAKEITWQFPEIEVSPRPLQDVCEHNFLWILTVKPVSINLRVKR